MKIIKIQKPKSGRDLIIVVLTFLLVTITFTLSLKEYKVAFLNAKAHQGVKTLNINSGPCTKGTSQMLLDDTSLSKFFKPQARGAQTSLNTMTYQSMMRVAYVNAGQSDHPNGALSISKRPQVRFLGLLCQARSPEWVALRR